MIETRYELHGALPTGPGIQFLIGVYQSRRVATDRAAALKLRKGWHIREIEVET